MMLLYDSLGRITIGVPNVQTGPHRRRRTLNDPTTIVPVLNSASLSIRGAGMTHVGCVREHNEDSILTDPTGALWVVADGMGGHGHGDVASDIVIERLSTMPDDGDPPALLASLLEAANRDILEKAAEYGGATMGATVVALMIKGAFGHIAWAGDSRVYLCRRDIIRLLTRDHSVVQDLVEQGVIDADRARHHEESNVVTRAVGAGERIDVDLVTVPLMPQDKLVLCSDGLTDCLDDSLIRNLVQSASDPENASRLLISAALDLGAPDNVSVVVIFVGEP